MTDTAIIDAILRREGGFVDHPADQGGPTKYGVTQRTLKQYRGRSVTVGDLRDLGESEARLIYQRLYITGPGFRPHRRSAGCGRWSSIARSTTVLPAPRAGCKLGPEREWMACSAR